MAAPRKGAALPWLLRKLARAAERDEETAANVLTVLQRGIVARPPVGMIERAAVDGLTAGDIAKLLVPGHRVGRPGKTLEHIRLAHAYDEAMALRKAGELTKTETDRVIDALAEVCGDEDAPLERATVVRIAGDMRKEAAATQAVNPEGIRQFVRITAKPRRK